MEFPCFLEDFFAGDHDAEVDDLVVVTAEDDAHDVFADVMNIAFDSGEQDFALCRLVARGAFFGLHEGGEVCHGLFHDAGRFDDLREEHFSFTEEVSHDVHAGHERSFDDFEGALELLARFLGVGFDMVGDAFNEGVLESLFDGSVAPRFGDGWVRGF